MNQLNQLLAKAKDSEQMWQDFQASGDWRREGFASIYRQREQDWQNLYKAIDANVPVRFVAAAGDVKTFATIGVMDQTLMLFYSSQADATYVMEGYKLSAIVEFLEPGAKLSAVPESPSLTA
jgi:hypothetical protein